MVLPTPNLDDRSFEDLVADAFEHVRASHSDWTDLSANDPGVVLIETFAHLTELMLFRMNQLPDKAYIAFLELLGVQPMPPVAAYAELVFSLDEARLDDVTLPLGLAVTVEGASDRGMPEAFQTVQPLVIPAGEVSARVMATHSVWHTGELLGRSSGHPRQTFSLHRQPVLGPDQIGPAMIVAVESTKSERAEREASIEYEGRIFSIWTEVPRFTAECRDQPVYSVDRFSGEIQFAPDLRQEVAQNTLSDSPGFLASLPKAGREIRVWYRTLADGSGRVAAGRLSGLVPPIPGLSVTNPAAAVAGRAAETLENALDRGPMSLHSLERAITARDFETLAVRASGGVNRALAIADAALWSHGSPGTVNICLVPTLPDAPTAVFNDTLVNAQQPSVLDQVQKALLARQALGTRCKVNWVRAKPVAVHLQADLAPGGNPATVAAAITERLDQLVNPLNRPDGVNGWEFGRSLFSWDVLRAVGDVAGVAGLANIRLAVEEAPDTDVKTLSRDAYQPNTFYTASGSTVFRSGNDGASWEPVIEFDGEEVVQVQAYTPTSGDVPSRAGLLAVVTKAEETSRLYVSRDCAEHFDLISQFQFDVSGLAWIFRDRVASLLLAARTGLFEVLTTAGSAPRQLVVEQNNPQMGVSAVAVSLDLQGRMLVAVAGAAEEGVFLSTAAGESGSFENVGLEGELVRVLMIQHTTTQRWLWAGVSAVGNDTGNGCFRVLLQADGLDLDGWHNFREGWVAGGCRTLALNGQQIYAGSLRRGVLVLDPDGNTGTWRTPDVSCGLPLRDVSRLEPINALAAGHGTLMAAGPKGVYVSGDAAVSFASCAETYFNNEVSLPSNWLFCSGTHVVKIGDTDAST